MAKQLSPESVERMHRAMQAKAEAKRSAPVAKRAPATPISIQDTFVLTSRVKTQASPTFGQGFPVGFAVNGVEAPQINVLAGKTYNFTVISSCIHPFYLSFDSRGRGRAPVPDGWVDQFGDAIGAPSNFTGPDPVCGGKSILWTPPIEYVGTYITYQCFVHDNMGWIVSVKNQSLCDKYTQVLQGLVGNNAGLLNALVGAVLADLTNATNPDNILADYFDGAVPTNSTDYTLKSSAPQLAALQSGLVSFFGDLLGCSDGSIAPYSGPSMKQVHADIPIDGESYDAFVTIVGDHASAFGVSDDDVATIANVLNSQQIRGQVCNFAFDCEPSLCNQYSPGVDEVDNIVPQGANLALMTAVVGAVLNAELADPLIAQFFNGLTPPGSTNFTDPKQSAALTDLTNQLIAFFGGPAALSCTDPTFPATAISVPDLQGIHALMPINTTVFNRFNDIFDTTLLSLNVTQDDVNTIRGVLNSTEPLICNQPGCSTIPLPPSNSSGSNATANPTVNYIVTIAPKSQAINPNWYNIGFASNYLINGQYQQGTNVFVGTTYVFTSNVSCFHPFYLTSGFGAGSAEITEGETSGAGVNVCTGTGPLVWTPTEDQINTTIYYQCRNHQYMGGRVCVNAAGSAPGPCLIQSAAVNPATLTPCDDLAYNIKQSGAAAQFPNESAIITGVVVNTFLAAVTGSAPLLQFFNGTAGIDPGRDFVHNLTLQGELVAGLVKFFGGALGCSDNSIDTAYSAADPAPDIKQIHEFMNISQDQFNLFNTVLMSQFTNFSGTGASMTLTNQGKVYVFLNATDSDICAGCSDYVPLTLCEKWATSSSTFQGDQLQMMTAVVTGVFGNLTGMAPTKSFFDGTVPCSSRDFVDNAVIRSALVTQLVAFFGSSGVLGCTQGGFPQYTGNTNMAIIHEYMPITQAIFDDFVNALVGVVTGALAADVPSLQSDLAVVGALLNSNGVYVICNQADCTANPQNSPKNGQSSYVNKANTTLCPAPPVAFKPTSGSSTAGATTSTVGGTTGAGTSGGTTAAGTTGAGTTAGTTGTTGSTAPSNVNNGAVSFTLAVLVAVISTLLTLM